MQRLGDILEADNAAIFNDFRDFTELLTVTTNTANAREVMGSLQSDLVTFNASMSEVLNAFAIKLFMPEQADLNLDKLALLHAGTKFEDSFMPEQADLNLDKGQILYVQNKAYRIVAISLNMGIRELSLEKK